MHPVLRNFVFGMVRMVSMALAPVVLTAFLTTPYYLERLPASAPVTLPHPAR